MRHKISVRLAAVLLLLALLPAPARAAAGLEYLGYAEALAPLGIFIGTGSDFELDKRPTRIQGLVVLIRLLGAENDAKAMSSGPLPFTDVAEWSRGYAAYALEKGLTQGMSAVTFGSDLTLEPRMFCTFLLRALGYSDSQGDFEYNSAVQFAHSIGLLQSDPLGDIQDGIFTRGHMAKLSCDALLFARKDSGMSLLDWLVDAGKIDPERARVFLASPVSGSRPPDKSLTELALCASGVVKLECEYGTGSGVVLSTDGLIVTSYHVIKGEPRITVTFDDGAAYIGPVYIIDYSEALDLALVKIEKTGLSPIQVGDSAALKRGERVVAIGSPMGYVNSLSEGIVSAFSQVYGIDAIQFTAPISRGSSGGALLDMQGRLVGITFAAEFDGQNIGFAVPALHIAELTRELWLTPETLVASLITPFSPALSLAPYADSGDVPDFGHMYAIAPAQTAYENGYALYVYDGVTMEHINEYEDFLESIGYTYDQQATEIACSGGIFTDPAAFVKPGENRVVVTDVYYYGEILALAVMFELR